MKPATAICSTAQSPKRVWAIRAGKIRATPSSTRMAASPNLRSHLVEVQGYVYLAKLSLAEIYERAGDHDAAQRLRAEAHELQNGFETRLLARRQRIFMHWPYKPEETSGGGFIECGASAMVGNRTTRSSPENGKTTMSKAMFSGWGIRTLSDQERRFNPVGYHLGTVWPHDNSIIAAGMRNYGCDKEACAVMSGIVHAAGHFEHFDSPRCLRASRGVSLIFRFVIPWLVIPRRGRLARFHS